MYTDYADIYREIKNYSYFSTIYLNNYYNNIVIYTCSNIGLESLKINNEFLQLYNLQNSLKTHNAHSHIGALGTNIKLIQARVQGGFGVSTLPLPIAFFYMYKIYFEYKYNTIY